MTRSPGGDPQRAELVERLHGVIDRGADAPMEHSDFERLALDVFAYQFERNRIYRAYCQSRGALPESVSTWLEIPAVPTDAFKAAPLTCGDPAEAATVFRTSGTTLGGERRGVHYLLATDLYRASLRASFRSHLIPEREKFRIAALVPPPGEAPESSLSFMIGDLIETVGEPGSRFFVRDGALDVGAFLKDAQELVAADQPVLVAGTSFAFVHLLDQIAADGVRLRLPEGSRAMDTGGFKGRSREIERAELYRMMEEGLGVPARRVVNEYGMTEMSSQMYDGVVGSAPEAGEPRWHRAPPWVRSLAVDPETLEPQPTGETGVLRHVDLANLYSVAALQTADFGRVSASGVELMGRAAGAEARGCSIAMDELLEVMQKR